MPSVSITESNPALATLRRSWITAEYSGIDGIGPMGSLHEAGDALVAVARLDGQGLTVLGSGVMVGPGLLLTATHVADEFPSTERPPLFLTFLPHAARVWLPKNTSTLSAPSGFSQDRKQISDITLFSCTLNSEAYVDHPLTLASLQIALPLIGDRLWAFGFRHGAIEDGAALVTPFASSGLVTEVFPNGRGERMPASCIEVAMETVGGMSGGPVVNANGDLVGIVTSSFDGGPSYITLIWDALRLRVRSPLQSIFSRDDIDLISAARLGLVRLNGNIKRGRRGDVVVTFSHAEFDLMAKSIDPAEITRARAAARGRLDKVRLECFAEEWLPEMEHVAAIAAIQYLKRLELSSMTGFLASDDIPAACLAPIQRFEVEDFEGLEDPEILSAREEDGSIFVSFAFELLTVVWIVEVAHQDYCANASAFETHFLNIETHGESARMEVMQRCYFEADLRLDQRAMEFASTSITLAGVMRSRTKGTTGLVISNT